MMLWSCILGAALAAARTGLPATGARLRDRTHELTITSGPFDLPNMPPMDSHAMMDLGMSHDTRSRTSCGRGWLVPRYRSPSPMHTANLPGRDASSHHGEFQPPPAPLLGAER